MIILEIYHISHGNDAYIHRANICDFIVLGVALPPLPLEGKCQNKIFKFYREAHSIMRILGVLELIFSFKTIPERNYSHFKHNIFCFLNLLI